jgi:N4-gp56 family major capsid protein
MSGTVYSDLISTNALPDAMRVIFSNMLEFTARPVLVTDQPEFVEMWPEFAAKRGATVTRTIYHQLAPTIGPLTENTDVVGGSLQDHQVSLTIQEYGNALGTTEALDLLSYHGPISTIIKTVLGQQMALTLDTLARNALWYAPNLSGGVRFRTYSDAGRADRAHLTATDVLTAATVRATAHNLGVRQVPTLGDAEPTYVAITHPSTIYDLRGDPQWKDANLYAGSTRIFSGEEGMIHGVRFLKSTRHRVANGGALTAQSTLDTGSYPAGSNTLKFVSVLGFNVGDEITVHRTGVATTAPPLGGGGPVSWTAPDGQDTVSEELVIAAINSGTRVVTFTNKTLFDHIAGDYVTEALDVYPISFMGGVQPLAKGVALAPEVRVALPTDKLRRMSYVGWYCLQGYGVARDWAYEINEVAASRNVAPVYGI